MFMKTHTLTRLPLKVHHLTNNSTTDIFEPNIEDLQNLGTIGIKELQKLEDNDSIRQAFKDSVIKKMEDMMQLGQGKNKIQILLTIMTYSWDD